MTILDFFSQLKNWQLSKGYFGSWGHALVAVSFVGRFQQESMYGLNTRTKKLAIVKKWPLVKVWLYFGDHKLPLVSPGPIFFFYGVLRGGGGAYKQKVTVYWHVLHVKKSIRNNSRGRVQEIPPPPRDDARLSNTTGILQKPLLYHFDVFSAVHIMLLPSQKLPFRICF